MNVFFKYHFIFLVILLSGCLGNNQDPDPIIQDFAIAYVKRPMPVNNEGEPTQENLQSPFIFSAGGDLYVRDRASPSAAEKNVTQRITGLQGDVKDVNVSFDGRRLIFALRLPEIENADDEDQPKWNIWQYNLETDVLRRIIRSDILAEEGHDLAPHYLPDGRIVFSSTRQRQSGAILLDEGKPQFSATVEGRNDPAMLLHVMSEDGSDIHQISFNQSHDLSPTVLENGKILFNRWDNMGSRNAFNLYTINPDGTALNLVYGSHSHNTGTNTANVQFTQARERPDGRIMSILRPTTGTFSGGDIILIDIKNFADADQKLANSTSKNINGQLPATNNTILTDTSPSLSGRFGAAYPFWDGTDRALVSWTPCRLVENKTVTDPGIIVPCSVDKITADDLEEAAPLYGVYIYNRATHTQLPITIPEENIFISDLVSAQPRTAPTIILDQIAGADLNADYIDEGVGVLHIRSVYDFDGRFNNLNSNGENATSVNNLADPALVSADERAARFLRIVKAVSIPDNDILDFSNSAFGRSRQQQMREIIGYTPVDPDGSVKVKVPANVPLAISILDKNGRRIGARHQNWIQVRPGETLECNGCHNHNEGLPHGRAGAITALNEGASTSGLPFPNTEIALLAQISETMAETRIRLSCKTDCAALEPSVNINYDDTWTAATVRAKDASFSYRYANLNSVAPTSNDCQSNWTSRCRIVIHYETHIHPLWSQNRQILDGNGELINDNTCTRCHNPIDANNNAQVPAAQLDLTDGPSADNPDHFRAYRELFFADNEQEIVNNVLVDRLIQETDSQGNLQFQLDSNGQRIPVMVTVRVARSSMSVAGANSGSFLTLFDTGGTHNGRLSDAEKKLISEWLDIGAQYYNNPFAAPLD
ncbi:MAG: hypothetical protein GXP14_06440 [Gammaproteobacteria bacterium]|nr:hypothetical protein [Gammaproteobacteria bacterium]